MEAEEGHKAWESTKNRGKNTSNQCMGSGNKGLGKREIQKE
jgi:hypothetical protein